MRPLFRKVVASAAAAAVVLGAVPPAAWAGAAGSAQQRATAAAAMKQLEAWGVFRGDSDPLKSYLGSDDPRLSYMTPLGAALYAALKDRFKQAGGAQGVVEALQSYEPGLKRLRDAGPADVADLRNMARVQRQLDARFGPELAQASSGVGDAFQHGMRLQALMTGAAVAAPPKTSALVQVAIPDGFEFWDKKGLVYRINKANATTYNRELQKQQRLMNRSRPPQVAFVPETGRYNGEMFDYSYWRMKDQYDALEEGYHRDRMILLAELLGVVGKFKEDMWFTDKSLEKDLVEQARSKSYDHLDVHYDLLQLVDGKFAQRVAYLDAARKGLERYQTDMNRVKEEMKADPIVSDTQVKSLSLDELYATRYLSLGVLETQSFYVKNQQDRLDPSSPDSEQVMKAIDESKLSDGEKTAYKFQATKMVAKLEALRQVLEGTRKILERSDYAGNMDMANSALAASQDSLTRLTSEYSLYVEIPSVAYLGREQADLGWYNPGSKAVRGLYRLGLYHLVPSGSHYAAAMDAIEANRPKFDAILRRIAGGDLVGARRAAIAMNPDAVATEFGAGIGAAASKINDGLLLAASLQKDRDRIGQVFETNKWLDSAGNFVNWTVSLALAAPALRFMANTGAGSLMRFTAEVPEGASFGFARRLIRRGAIVGSETMQHTAARLESLDPSRAWLEGKAQTAVGRYLLASSVRGMNVAARQLSFTGMSGGISGAFVLGQHLWDQASLTVGGHELLKPGHSMFTGDASGALDAAWTGFKGGVWWANESWHPALGYVGLPSTAFRGTRLAGAMDVFGARGVAGTLATGVKRSFSRLAGTSAAAAVDESATRGFLERLAERGPAGKLGAFSLGMADNVAKYALFSEAAGWVGRGWGYYMPSLKVPVLGDVGGWRDARDVETRIKGANQLQQKFLASPAWLLIPTFAAHQARDAAVYQRAGEGMRQFDEAGMTADYANAREGEQLRFLKTPKVPLSQRVFEFNPLSDTAGDYWIVTKEVRREGIQKEMIRSLAPGVKDAKPSDINPMEFYRATQVPDGENFLNLKVNDEVRLVAHRNFIEALLADPVRTKAVLDAKPGTAVEGFGDVTPEVQKDVAVALYSSNLQVGKPMPAEVSGRVKEILAPYLEANESVKPFAKAYVDALRATPSNKNFDAVLDGVQKSVTEWRESGAKESYMKLVAELRANADSLRAEGKISEPEHQVLAKMYDYIAAVERRFNSFNNVKMVGSLAHETLDALRTEYGQREAPRKLADALTASFDSWSRANSRPEVDGPKSDGSFQAMLKQLGAQVESARPGLTDAEYASFKNAVNDISSAPWVLHDAKGHPLRFWYPEQFESLTGAMTAFSSQGRAKGSVRLFQMLKTGGGKTMLTFEGLLPLVEADAAARSTPLRRVKPIFLTVQSNLEAQARMEFIAYKKIGSNLDFDTYEGFKTKIAEGKTKGRNVMRDYWIMGDEMDGAALQPALTIGQVSGYIARRSPVYNEVERIDTGLSGRLNRLNSARGSRVLTEARRLQSVLSRMDAPDAAALKIEGTRLEIAAGRLKEASSEAARVQAQNDLAASAQRLDALLDAVPSRESGAVSSARGALGRLRESLRAPPEDPKARRAELSELEAGFARQRNLLGQTGSLEGLARLATQAEARGVELQARIERLTAEADAAGASKARGAGERAALLRAELDQARRELGLVERFRSVDSGQRLSGLQDRLAAAQDDPGYASPGKVSRWSAEAEDAMRRLTPEAQGTARDRARTLAKLYQTGRELRALDDGIAEAARDGRPAEDLKARRSVLESDYSTLRAETLRQKASLTAGGDADLGGMLRRLDVLSGERARLSGSVRAAKARGERAPPEAARLTEVDAERDALIERAKGEARRLLDQAARDALAQARDGGPGWQDRVSGLMERRRQMMEAFAGDENPMYSVFREMNGDMGGFYVRMRQGEAGREQWSARVEKRLEARRAALKAQGLDDAAIETALKPERERLEAAAPGDQERNALTVDQLKRALEGKPLSRAPLQVLKGAWDAFRGRESSVPPATVGLTRIYAAKMLRALFRDPTMSAHQRDTLFWNLASSLLWPRGISGEGSSWVRTEALRQFRGYFEDPAGIRLDGLSGRINVVHNGQWFESMDNETRRFWELEYGVDLTLPYTHQSISTIKDVTTDEDANFISFSGTAGDKLREHFGQNKIRMTGEGSKAPTDPDRAVLDKLDEMPPSARDLLTERLGRAPQVGDVVRLSDLGESADAAARGWLEGRPRADAVKMNVVDGPGSRFTRIGEALDRVNAARGRVVVESLSDAPAEARAQIEQKLGGPLTQPRSLALADFPDGSAAREWLTEVRERQGDADRVVLRKTDEPPAGVKSALDGYLARRGLEKKDAAVVRVSEVRGVDEAQTREAQDWLRGLRSAQKDTGLVVLSVSDTHVLKQVRRYLLRSGVKADEIAMVFSDTEYLRSNVPAANVKKQMNLEALNDGRARVLILDTRVGGRGLDLNFKGDGESLAADAFRGYTDFEMLIVDPQKMSSVHLLQAEGRIDVGRVLPAASRDFSLVMDVRSVQGERVFRDMIARDPFFEQLRSDPKFQDFVRARGVSAPDWSVYHDYVRARAADGTVEGAQLAEEYRGVVKQHLKIQQAVIEEDQLSSASIIQAPVSGNGVYPNLEKAQ